MAKAASLRRHRVLSSGRLTGTTKITCNKKQAALRKTAHSDAESVHSLYSTDSEDQVATIHNGLDRCAALLKDILQNESERTETVYQKPGKASSVTMTTRTLVNGSKKRGAKKTTHSTQAHQKIVPVSNRKQASVSKAAAEKDRAPVSTGKPFVQPGPAPFPQCSPVIHQKLCEHVQTQMSLLNIQPPQISPWIPEVAAHTVPENGCQPVAAFNCRLPTSTPALSPQHPTDPSVVQSAHEEENRCGEADEQCQAVAPIQAQSSDSQEETAENHKEETLRKEEDLHGVEVAPVRDTSCQTSFDEAALKPQQRTLQEMAKKMKTVKYFLRELKALLTDHEDSEILRLLGEVEGCLSLLPAAADSSNLEAKIALAVQPLRSENAQLRRQLRILNQQLKEQRRAEEDCSPDGDIEFTSLLSLNRTLRSQLNESVKSIESLQNKNEELSKTLESQREEERRLTRIIHEREQELLEKNQQNDIESTKSKMEADEMLASVKNLQYKVEAAEKENRILGLTLRQRDAEVNRLRELTRALQGSMSRLLSDLTVDTQPKPGKGLSKAVLELHEKQLQPDPYPLSASVMSYLQSVETDPVQVNAEPLSKGERKEVGPVDERAAEQPRQRSPPAAPAEPAPANTFAFLKPDAEAGSDFSTLVGAEKLDETIYIPLTSSPSRRLSAAAGRCGQPLQGPEVLGPNFGVAESERPSRFGVLSEATAFDQFSGSCTRKKTVENRSENTGKAAELGGRSPQTQPKEIANGAAKKIWNDPGRLRPDEFFYAPISHCKGSAQKKGTGISAPDSSFSTFDGLSKKSEWTISSFSTFTSQDEEDFKNGLAALDANIARLQQTLQNHSAK